MNILKTTEIIPHVCTYRFLYLHSYLYLYFIFILYLHSYLFPLAWWQHRYDVAAVNTQTYRQTAFDRLDCVSSASWGNKLVEKLRPTWSRISASHKHCY